VNSININIERLNHLLKLYRLSREDIVLYINEGLKKHYTKSDIFKSEIKISLLKKIDTIFNKGLNYYLDPKDLKVSKEESIFFRKDKFNAELSLGAKQIVTQFEEEKISLSALSKLSDLKTDRILSFYTVKNDPKKVANEIRKFLYPDFNDDKKEFLISLINKLSEYNIYVFEFIETWNKKEKANINGFYLTPNVLVLKRNQKSFRREIFTLIHELGHYLLNEEEIDEKISENALDYNSLSKVERWCSNFAYYFLIGNYDSTINNLEQATPKNDFHNDLISSISRNTNLSTISLYNRLLLNNKISPANYKNVSNEILERIKNREAQEKLAREIEKEKAEAEGRKLGGSMPKPIQSPLFIKTVQSAFFEGVINEAEFCRRLNIKADKIEKYLQ
jgi:Zn-dependent peptidase ImmA (M78 family)